MSRSLTGVRVAVDAMGGDFGVSVAVAGSVSAARRYGVSLTLVGREAAVRSELTKADLSGLVVSVVDAPEEVGMAEKVGRPTLKKRSSILIGIEIVERGEADAFFSAGNTAACWTIAKTRLGTLTEIDRPALTAVVPNIKGKTVLLDVGANATCKVRHLEEFAVMGSLYAEEVLKIATPRVGLMSMGEEESKGTDLTREVHAALKDSHLNFIGNVEGHEIFNGEADVVVMDGFTGNAILKSSETLASSIVFMLKEEIRKRPLAMVGALLASGAFEALKRRIDPREVGGAPLLGIKGCCVIGHGKSDEMAICEGIRMAGEFSKSGINSKITVEVARLSRLSEPTETVVS
ncbi:MAG: phosphate acyltransferase PlsX [Vicinamibacteria bacterium]|nr:phosphate acyltransferase PlsX [Vicinamibacteria bacterium]